MQNDPATLIVLPLGMALGLLLLAAAIYDLLTFRRRRRHRDKVIYRCASCRRIYAEVHRTPLARCPACGQQNEPVPE